MIILNNSSELQTFKIMKTGLKAVNGSHSKYYTKAESDSRFQPYGDYITDEAVKTINGESIIGTGDIEIIVDTYTKDEIDDKFENVEVDLTGYATETWVNAQGYLTSIPDEYVTKTYVDNIVGVLNEQLERI